MSEPTTILIVEDEQSMIRIWSEFLAPLKGEVRIAMTIESAIEQMARVPYPDIVLLDLRLPHSQNAEETLKAINVLKDINPKTVVVVLTGAVDGKLAELASQLGADAYANKMECATQVSLLNFIGGALAKRSTNPKAPAFENSLALLEQLHNLTCPDPIKTSAAHSV